MVSIVNLEEEQQEVKVMAVTRQMAQQQYIPMHTLISEKGKQPQVE